MQYRSRYKLRQSYGAFDYIMPFLIIIAVGVIAVLIVSLWRSVFNPETKIGAYMHIVEGSAQLKTWGTDDFFDLRADALVIGGDEVRSSADAKIIFEFFDGTVMRVNGSTDVVFESLEDEKDGPKVQLLLVAGEAWFNKVYKGTGDTLIEVKTGNAVIRSDQTGIFELENDFDEIIRVINGKDVLVDVMSADLATVIETEAVGVGQEVILTEKVLEKYREFQSPNLSGISDSFKVSDWYKWNTEEDQNPTEFTKIIGDPGNTVVEAPPEVMEEEVVEEEFVPDLGEDAISDSGEDEVAEDVVDESVEDVAGGEDTAISGSLTAPTIYSVSGVTTPNADGFYEISSYVGTLTGGVSGAGKVMVNGYTLQKFMLGDETWTYYANANYDLMKEGENSYKVTAYDADGNESESIVVKVYYSPPAVVVEEVVSEEAVVEDGAVENGAEDDVVSADEADPTVVAEPVVEGEGV